MKTYKQLFLEIANSTDYNKNWLTGASWRYYVDETDKRVYVQFQETKTIQDWIFNFIVIPKKLVCSNVKIEVPLGNYLQFNSIYKDIVKAITPYLINGYKLYITGWSQGGVTAGLFAFYMSLNTQYENRCIMYGTPKFLKDVEPYAHVSYINFLYPDDPIKDVVPDYHRPPLTQSSDFVPDFEPVSLDDKHRIYGHSSYTDLQGNEAF